MKRPKIALFDLDGTLADYDGQLLKDLQRIASPHEPPPVLYQDIPYLEARRHVITSQSDWFRHLPKFKLGWDVLEVAKKIGYSISILTKAPSRKHAAWSEKVEWCATHLEDYIDGVTIAHDKGMVYGALLVDDWPAYVEAWLKHRPRGLVIMPANGHNEGFSHPNVVRYDGSNLEEVRQRMQERFDGLGTQQSTPLAVLHETVKDFQAIGLMREPVYNIAELASRVTKENRPDPEDVDFGEPTGKEKL